MNVDTIRDTVREHALNASVTVTSGADGGQWVELVDGDASVNVSTGGLFVAREGYNFRRAGVVLSEAGLHSLGRWLGGCDMDLSDDGLAAKEPEAMSDTRTKALIIGWCALRLLMGTVVVLVVQSRWGDGAGIACAVAMWVAAVCDDAAAKWDRYARDR